VKLSALLPSAQIRVPLVSRTKEAAIEELLALLPLASEDERALVRDSVWDREREMSTGIGRGVAIPHGKTPAVTRHICAFGVAPQGVDFGAVDGLPCRIFFLCVSHPRDASQHIRMLLQMARVLNHQQMRGAIENAVTAEDVRKVFLEDEQREGL
jgi:mannitol/fructose-specific phosphotransferase system IIA component (Ntr-type)